jgi:hypothetical protein
MGCVPYPRFDWNSCLTQILAWGAIFYPPVLTVPLIAAERG